MNSELEQSRHAVQIIKGFILLRAAVEADNMMDTACVMRIGGEQCIQQLILGGLGDQIQIGMDGSRMAQQLTDMKQNRRIGAERRLLRQLILSGEVKGQGFVNWDRKIPDQLLHGAALMVKVTADAGNFPFLDQLILLRRREREHMGNLNDLFARRHPLAAAELVKGGAVNSAALCQHMHGDILFVHVLCNQFEVFCHGKKLFRESRNKYKETK